MFNYTDETMMPFGIHRNKKLCNVPADYLLFIFRENKLNEPLKKYIEENLEVLEAEEKIIKAERRLDMKNRYR
jgi:uncharacterized protein (DUF3820 family)